MATAKRSGKGRRSLKAGKKVERITPLKVPDGSTSTFLNNANTGGHF